MNSASYYIEYPLNLKTFSENNQKIITLMQHAGKKIGDIFDKQVGNDRDLLGANFYPKDATYEEILEASTKDKLILDPYTIVKRDSSGRLFAVYYHEEYKEDLTEVSNLLKQAAELSDHQGFKGHLLSASNVLLNGDYNQLLKDWVSVETDSLLNVMIGPLGSYADRLFSLKKAYNFNFTYTRPDNEFNPANYVDVIKNMLPPFGAVARQDVPADKIRVRVDNVIAIGGRNAALPARATNYPEDIQMIKEIGIKIVIYSNNIQKRDGEMLLPLFRDFIDPGISEGFSDATIMDNATRLVLLHEVTEALFQYKGSWERLKGMFNWVMELHSSIVGIKASGLQVIKNALDQKDLEAILYIMLMRTFSDYFVRKKTPQVENYLSGYRVFYNYCLQNGAIIVNNERILTNPAKMYTCADQLATVVMHLFSEGTEEEARRFFDQYISEYMYSNFSDKLSKYEF